ncbi:MAG: hypothetical protein EHM21_11870 [Chloroflexi bacterium]|nr:MAG: hypothetical protein EHM21_11870 [Chloroflexota bacterium]
MADQLLQLREILAEVYDLEHINNLLEWDQQTYMPSGGSEDRSYQRATVARLAHQRWTADETGRLIEDLSACLDALEPDGAALVRFARREYQKRARVPENYVAERTRATSLAHEAWLKARRESNFEAFRPFLEQVFDLRRQYAEFFAPYNHIYDPLLDDFERGLKTAEVQAIFNALRPRQVELIRAIGDRPQVDDRFMHQAYPEQAQWDFGVEVVTHFGYDWQRGRLDRTAHPFSIDFSVDDVRITTRFDQQQPATAMFGTMHEAGHAMYEQGVDPTLRR